ncbi:hypothetical protein JQK88_34580 [Mesorhizobium caraganae]|uniref:hypothetical protein n=1 Tax=Mesorhizobium caraganae TaxID=483206 RepID=UPI00193A96C1|nr:hypothetical protein [Mesorhizobium caraganae]MBM2716197.1 hypothetical protein [Mesorhizobium caraganae]
MINRRAFLGCCALCLSGKAHGDEPSFICAVEDSAVSDGLQFQPADGNGENMTFNTDLGPLTFTPYGTAFKSDIWLPEDSETKDKITLGVAFLNGEKPQHDIVMESARMWLATHIGTFIDFDFTASVDKAKIRIEVLSNQNWSAIGRRAMTVTTPYTMCFSDLHPASIMHEFGHCLGLQHEHRFPLSTIEWDKDAVFADMHAKGWSEETVKEQILTKLDKSAVCLASPNLDRSSIMMYPIKDGWATILNDRNERVAFVVNPSTISDGDVACVTGLYKPLSM